MSGIPYTREAYELLHRGTVALAKVECNGMAVDADYIDQAIERTNKKLKRMRDKLESFDVMKEWRKAFRFNVNLRSTEQLGHVLFEVMKFPCINRTDSGKPATDEKALEDIIDPFVDAFLAVKKLDKAVNTNLAGIKREIVAGRIHCFFNLNTVRSYRGSSDAFNFQNLPIRNEVIAQLIRGAFIASPGNQIVEVDYSGAEVKTACAYHRDPVAIAYELDDAKDMHRDTAMELFQLPLSEFEKEKLPDGTTVKHGAKPRYAAKNGFVFPQFYGDWYLSCAPNIWKMVQKITLRDGTPLIAHLKRKGIRELGELDSEAKPVKGTFVHAVKEAERSLWKDRLVVYDQWRRDIHAQYQVDGYVKSLSGFVYQGYMERKKVINYPVQGSAFHCLLWSLTRIVQRELPMRRMRTKVVGQIHDSIVADVVPAELDEYLAICKRVMTQLVTKRFPWLVVPMKIEADVAPVGGSWADKQPYKIED